MGMFDVGKCYHGTARGRPLLGVFAFLEAL